MSTPAAKKRHSPRIRVWATGAFLCFGLVHCTARAEETSDATFERRFGDVVQPFLKNYCLACHGPDKQQAKLDLGKYTSAAAVAKNFRLWDRVIERLEAEEMPPAKATKH